MQQASDPRLRARLQRLELRARTAVEGLRGGRHRSPLKGASTTFAQHREYVAGDDLRRLDWRLMARSDRNIIREYEEETDLRLWLVVDASASMKFHSGEWDKFAYATWLAAALARVACDQNDQFGLFLTRGGELERTLPPRGGEAHWASLCHLLAEAEPGGAGDPATGLQLAASQMDRRGLVVWISDLLGDPEEAASAANRLRRKGHDMIALRTLDHAEVEFPFVRNTRFEGLESEDVLRADPNTIRAAYLEEFEAHGAALRRGLRSGGCAFRRMPIEEPLEIGLVEFLAQRNSQKAGGLR
ncbi:MAG: DUF58 domain-containing protein [Planctomycetota bacterium]